MFTSLQPFRTLLAFIGRAEACRKADPPLRESGIVLAALMTEAIHRREVAGHHTTLRQLHRLLDIAQPTALRVAHLLAREGVVQIDENMSDRFESFVRLSPETQARFAALNSENIAKEAV